MGAWQVIRLVGWSCRISWWRSSNAGAFGDPEYPFIAIALRSTLNHTAQNTPTASLQRRKTPSSHTPNECPVMTLYIHIYIHTLRTASSSISSLSGHIWNMEFPLSLSLSLSLAIRPSLLAGPPDFIIHIYMCACVPKCLHNINHTEFPGLSISNYLQEVSFGFSVQWHINLRRLFNAKAILWEDQ